MLQNLLKAKIKKGAERNGLHADGLTALHQKKSGQASQKIINYKLSYFSIRCPLFVYGVRLSTAYFSGGKGDTPFLSGIGRGDQPKYEVLFSSSIILI